MTSRYYLLKGKIVQSSAPVPLAGVMVADQAITGLTNNAGVYILSKVSKDSSLQIISAKTGIGCAKLEGLRGIADDTTFIPNLSLQDEGGTITGTVYDTLNRPVAKAQVLALAGGLTDTATSSGQYRLINVPASAASLRIYVPDANSGLVGAISGVTVNEGKTVMGADIYLRPATSFTNNMMVQASDMVVADTAKTVAIPVLGLTTGSTRIASYQWYTTGGANPDTTTQNASLSIAPKTGSSSMNIAVRAISDSGLYSARTSITVKILSSKPVVQATVCSATDTVQRDSVTILQNDMAQFRGSAIAPFGGVDTMEWIFGDGSQWIASDTSANVGHSYDTNGTFKAVLKVRDAVGNIVCDTLKVIVQKPSIPAPSYVYPNNNDTVRTTSDTVQLSWNAVSGTSVKYNVYLSSQNTTPGANEKIDSLIAKTSANVVLVPGKRYYWYIEAVSSTSRASGVPWSFMVETGVSNSPPVFTSKPSDMFDTMLIAKAYVDTLRAQDPNHGKLTYSIIDSIPGMTLVDSIISLTPTRSLNGTRTVMVKVTNPAGLSDSLTWQVYINVLPTLAAPAYFSPANGDTNKTLTDSVTLSWVSSGAGVKYNVYKDVSNPPKAVYKSNLDTVVCTVPIDSGVTYYWQIEAVRAQDGQSIKGSVYKITGRNFNLLSGLVARWEFEGNGNDITGNGHNADAVHALFVPGISGSSSKAASFDGGINNYIEMPDVPGDTGAKWGKAFSISLWAKGPFDPRDRLASLMTQEIGAYSLYSTGANVQFAIMDTSGIGISVATSSLIPNQWQYFTVTYDGNILSIYKDGKLNNYTQCNLSFFSNKMEVVLGNYLPSSLAYPFIGGSLDDIRIYNRALAPYEITATYSAWQATNHKPTFLNKKADTTYIGRILKDTLRASDVDGDPIQFSLLSSPAYTSLQNDSIIICNAVGTSNQPLIVIANNGRGATDTLRMNVVIDSTILMQGLYAYYSFNMNGLGYVSKILDLSGNNRSTASPTTLFSYGIDRFGNDSSTFNPEAGYNFAAYGLSCGFDSTIGINDSLTISLWVNYSTINQQEALLSKDSIFSLELSNIYFQPTIKIRGSDSSVSTFNSTSSMTLNQWNHLVFVCDNSSIKIFINGALAGSKNYSKGFLNSRRELVLGGTGNLINGLDNWAPENFDGSMDDVRIYTRALTDAQILQLYNFEKP
jgi:hypothetical protein